MSSLIQNYKVYNNLLQMLKDRNYKNLNKFTCKLEEFNKKYNNDKDNIIHKKIIVYFLKLNKIKPSFLKEILKKYEKDYQEKNDLKKLILIFKKKINSNLLKLIISKKYNIEIFYSEDLIYNKTKHELVPKHILLNNNEINLIKKKFNIIKLEQLPFIPKTDPIVRWYGGKINDVFKIIRKNPNVGDEIYYRIVKNIKIK